MPGSLLRGGSFFWVEANRARAKTTNGSSACIAPSPSQEETRASDSGNGVGSAPALAGVALMLKPWLEGHTIASHSKALNAVRCSSHEGISHLPGTGHPGSEQIGISPRPLATLHLSIKIGDAPGLRQRVAAEAGNQMKVKVTSTLTKGDHINPVTTTHLLHQLGGTLHNQPPFTRFLRPEVGGSAKVATRIQQTPPRQGRRQGVMTQEPSLTAPDLEGLELFRISVNGADATTQWGLVSNGIEANNSSSMTAVLFKITMAERPINRTRREKDSCP